MSVDWGYGVVGFSFDLKKGFPGKERLQTLYLKSKQENLLPPTGVVIQYSKTPIDHYVSSFLKPVYMAVSSGRYSETFVPSI